ncbi:MAG TPA: efflux RND transporter permease subunit [Terriglobia bacterium]|nr:efflux RND transporter permease subunit [Terriglobia bacterium]
MFLSNLSIRQPVFATMMVVTLVVVGIVSYFELKIDLFPNIDIPVISITTTYPGVAPETVETEVTKRIEEAVNPIGGIRHISSVTTEGISTVMVEFQLEKNINPALQEAQSKINGIRSQFPREVEEPVIQQFRIEELPILSIVVLSPTLDAKALTTLAEKVLKRRLENISGVGQVRLVGAARREIHILLDRDKLKAFGLTYPEVLEFLRRENLDIPAGKLDQGIRESLVRVSGRARDPEEFNRLIVAERDGFPIPLSSIARVEDGIEEQRSFSLLDGEPALALQIQKQTGANTVDVADNVKEGLRRLQAEMPPGVELRVVQDNSIFIRDSVEDVRTTLIIGAILTVLVVFAFLNSWRSTVITGLTLPVSVISAFIIMRVLGFTLNVMTLMGLSLAIGMLIDDAIVVRENIVRHMERGSDHMTAAIEGTAEIGLAVMATTFTIIAVFIPVAFMGGIVGRFFYQFGMTVGFAVLVSLFVSFTLDPMLSSRWYDPSIEAGRRRGWLSRVLDRANRKFEDLRGVLGPALEWSLRHRATVVGIAVLSIVASFAIFGRLGSAFMADFDRGEFQIGFKMPPGTTLRETAAAGRRITDSLKRQQGVAYAFVTIGAGGTTPVNEGLVYVKLTPRSQRAKTDLQLRQVMREELARWPVLRASVEEAEQFGEARPIQISVRGTNLSELDAVAAQVVAQAKATPGTADVDTSREDPRPELRVRLDRKAASDLGLDLGTVASLVRGLVAGEVVSQFQDPDGDAYDVRLRLEEDQRRLREDLEDIYLPVSAMALAGGGPDTNNPGPPGVPLSQVASLEDSAAPSVIRRRDLMREVRVMSSTHERPLGDVIDELRVKNAALHLPAGVHIDYTGQAEDLRETFYYIYRALILAVIFIYAILASQFRSFFHPLAIMLSLPLSLVGVALMLWATHETLNIMSMIGLIMLMGLVTKNAILLVDYANRLRREGEQRGRALVRAAQVRLRPIIMTTLAMIFGMMPLAFEIGAGSEMRAPMARAVIGGLITSTLLTLIVVPVVYTFLDDWGSKLLGWWEAGTPVAAPVPVENAKVPQAETR